MRILAIIVTYKRASELAATIQALHDQQIPESDILVVNNSKNDFDTLQIVKQFSQVQWHHLTDNIASAGGFAYGMQKGIEADYDYVWLFNDDSRPVKNALDAVKDYLIDGLNKKLGFLKIGEPIKNNQSVLLYWKGVRVPKYVPISNELTETDLITFDGCFISVPMMKLIGFCDPQFFMGTYEFEYCLRAKDAGFKIYTVPNGLIHDEKKGAASGTPPWRQYYNTRNHLWLALHRKSLYIFNAWFIRELKYTIAILLHGNKKGERMLYKYRAIRDAFFNRRGKTYHPDLMKK
jgi:GT2 family glycosyltransferase